MCNLEEFFSTAVSLRDNYLEQDNTSSQDIEVETWKQIVAEYYSIGEIPKNLTLKYSTSVVDTDRVLAAAKALFSTVSIKVEGVVAIFTVETIPNIFAPRSTTYTIVTISIS